MTQASELRLCVNCAHYYVDMAFYGEGPVVHQCLRDTKKVINLITGEESIKGLILSCVDERYPTAAYLGDKILEDSTLCYTKGQFYVKLVKE